MPGVETNKHTQQKEAVKTHVACLIFIHAREHRRCASARLAAHRSAWTLLLLFTVSIARGDRQSRGRQFRPLSWRRTGVQHIIGHSFPPVSVKAYIPRRIALPVQSLANVRMKSLRSRAPDGFPFPFHGTIHACNAMQCLCVQSTFNAPF